MTAPTTEAQALREALASADLTTLDTVRAGDHVLHAPTGEAWVVAWADPVTNDLAWCGWPNGIARLSDCTLTKAASDEEHQQTLRRLKASGDSRAAKALRLYGEPQPAPARDDMEHDTAADRGRE